MINEEKAAVMLLSLEEDLAADGLRPGGGAYYSYRLGEKKLLHPLSALAISAGW